MNSSQLLTAAENVLSTLSDCGVKRSVQEYQRGLLRGVDTTGKKLEQVASKYLDAAAGFDHLELTVVRALRLSQLQSPAFWFDLTAHTVGLRLRLARLNALRINIEYATSRLPEVLSLIGGSGFKESQDDICLLRLRIDNAVEKASHPDRLSRLIDAVDIIYQACAELAGEHPDDLALLSITGYQHRIIEFKGHPEVATATRRIIRSLHQQATESLLHEHYSVDQIAEKIPVMHALDELFRIQALNADSANRIREGVLAGSIMLLECGARIQGDALMVSEDQAEGKDTPYDGGVGLAETEELPYLNLKSRLS